MMKQSSLFDGIPYEEPRPEVLSLHREIGKFAQNRIGVMAFLDHIEEWLGSDSPKMATLRQLVERFDYSYHDVHMCVLLMALQDWLGNEIVFDFNRALHRDGTFTVEKPFLKRDGSFSSSLIWTLPWRQPGGSAVPATLQITATLMARVLPECEREISDFQGALQQAYDSEG